MASVAPKDLAVFGSANMHDDDTGTPTGGAIDKTVKPNFTDMSAEDTVSAVSSSGSDTTQDVVVHFRKPGGALVNETISLNGQTLVDSVLTAIRLEKAIKQASCAGDVAVIEKTAVGSGTAVSGGTDYIEVADASIYSIGQVLRTTGGTGPNQIREIVDIDTTLDYLYVRDFTVTPDGTTTYSIHNGMVFEKSIASAEVMECRRIAYDNAAEAAGGSQRDVYEKIFLYNLSTDTDLTNAVLEEVAGGAAAKIDFDLETSLDGTDNNGGVRTVAPGGYTFDSNAKDIGDSGDGNFDFGAGQGVWARVRLPAGEPAANSYYTFRVTGTTI